MLTICNIFKGGIMKLKRSKKSILGLILIVLLISQSSLAFAAKPTKPTDPPVPTSQIDITTSNLNLTIPENQNLSFDVALKKTSDLAITWSEIGTSTDLLSAPTITTSTKSVKRSTTYYETATYNFTPIDIEANTIYSYTINAYNSDVNQDSITVTITVTPVTSPPPVPEEFVYVALGDSIPSGVSYEYNIFGGTIDSYADKMDDYFSASHTNYSFYDLSVSGDNAIDLYQDLQTSSFQTLISRADVITLCIGANDIMDAAPEATLGRDFYYIQWSVANSGRTQFESLWPQIIGLIDQYSDAKLMVMTIYNPYNQNDLHSYSVESGMDPNLTIHDQVEWYMENTSNTPGLNTIIRNTANQTLGLDYRIVEVHNYFEKYYPNSKQDVTGFYGLTFLGIPVKDPHPDKNGQTVIYGLHTAAYELQ